MKYKVFTPIIFAFALLLQSCTGIMIYFIEASIVEEIEEEFDLRSSQEDWVEAKVHSHIQYLRRDLLKDLVVVMEEGHKDYADKITIEELDSLNQKTKNILESYLTMVINDAGEFVALVDDEQWSYHLKNKHKHEDEDKEEDDDDSSPRTMDDIFNEYEDMYGYLSREQKDSIAKLYNNNPNNLKKNEFSFELNLLEDHIAGIDKEANPQKHKKAVEAFLFEPEKIIDSLPVKEILVLIREKQERFVAVDNLMLPDQREQFSKRIAKKIDKARSYMIQ